MYKLSVERSGGDCFGMSVSQGHGEDLQGAFGERYRLAQVALLLIEDSQVMQCLSYLGMVLTEVLFSKSERAEITVPPARISLARHRELPNC